MRSIPSSVAAGTVAISLLLAPQSTAAASSPGNLNSYLAAHPVSTWISPSTILFMIHVPNRLYVLALPVLLPVPAVLATEPMMDYVSPTAI